MRYDNKWLLMLFINALVMLGVLAMPEMAWAGRLDSIASEIAGGSDKKIQQLIVIGITVALFIPLLGMLYLATEKKGLTRVGGYIGAVVLGAILYLFHFT